MMLSPINSMLIILMTFDAAKATANCAYKGLNKDYCFSTFIININDCHRCCLQIPTRIREIQYVDVD
jgi:hypothetical protein